MPGILRKYLDSNNELDRSINFKECFYDLNSFINANINPYIDSEFRNTVSRIDRINNSSNENYIDELNTLDYQTFFNAYREYSGDEKTFGQKIEYYLDTKNITRYELSQNTLISESYLSKIVWGLNEHVDYKYALAICVGLKLTYQETLDLLSRLGYTFPTFLNNSSEKTKYYFVVSYFLYNHCYNLMELNSFLVNLGLKPLNRYRNESHES